MREKNEINPMQNAHDAPRCGAKRKYDGKSCRAPAMFNGRCRLHGGKSTGALKGVLNGNYRTGEYTQEAISQRRKIRELLRMSKEYIKSIDNS